jgi:hypothetical protein
MKKGVHAYFMATSRYTIIYESKTKRYKLCRILLTSDGSYFVTCPYHESNLVSLMKRTFNFPNPKARSNDAPLEYGLVDDDDHRLKLSHHPDGFVQFSGNGILSGRNSDGTPKGIGLMSWPLSRPTAGPACAVTILNPQAFKKAGPAEPTDIIFRADDLYQTDNDNGLAIELYYFPGLWRRFVKASSHGPVIWLKHPRDSILELRVCKSPADSWKIGFLGVDLWSCPVRFGDAKSGFALSSSTGGLHYNDEKELEGQGLLAIHPAVENISIAPMELAFPKRDNPPDTKGGAPLSAG